MSKKGFIYAILCGIIGLGSIGGAVAFGLLWKKDTDLKLNNNKNDNSKEPNSSSGLASSKYTSEKQNSKNLPKTIKELKSKYPKYYSELNDSLTKKSLFEALNKIQMNYRNKVKSYGDLWKTYQVAFKDQYDEKDNTLYDIYSEKVGQEDDFKLAMPSKQDRGKHNKPGDSYNREHLIPQSIFGKKSKYIHNDAHFVFGTDSVINGLRSNYPHDAVIKPSKKGNSFGGNDWKLGTGINTNGQIAFEPDDHFKGDIARAYFYFMLTWHNYIGISGNGLSSYLPLSPSAFPYFKQSFLKEYISWSKKDPVDEFDINRNNLVAQEQGGLRNPFIDMPILIDLIWK